MKNQTWTVHDGIARRIRVGVPHALFAVVLGGGVGARALPPLGTKRRPTSRGYACQGACAPGQPGRPHTINCKESRMHDFFIKKHISNSPM